MKHEVYDFAIVVSALLDSNNFALSPSTQIIAHTSHRGYLSNTLYNRS